MFRIIASVLLVIVGFAALYGGFMFMIDPSGYQLGISRDLLVGTPFDNYMVPGIILFVVVGLFSLVSGVLTILRNPVFPWLLMIAGLILMGWLTVQLFMNSGFFSPLFHYPLYAVGISLLLIGFLERRNANQPEPSTYRKNKEV